MANEYYDAAGFPGTIGQDFGDSAAIWGSVMALEPNVTLAKLAGAYLGRETPLRHPDKNKWYGLDWRFSRDQLVPYLAGLLVMKSVGLIADPVIKRLFQMHRRRLFVLAWNVYRNHVYPTHDEHLAKSTPDVAWRPEPKAPDLTGPDVWALWLRLYLVGRGFFLARPIVWLLLNVLDLECLIGSVHWRYRTDRVTRNHLLVSIIAREFTPTLTSRLNFRICKFDDLISRWSAHCEATGELNTAPMFREALKMAGKK